MIAAGGGYSRHEHNANVLKLHPVMTLVHTIANRMYAKQIQFTVTDMLLSIFRLDALALSVIATATWLGGCLSQPVLYQND